GVLNGRSWPSKPGERARLSSPPSSRWWHAAQATVSLCESLGSKNSRSPRRTLAGADTLGEGIGAMGSSGEAVGWPVPTDAEAANARNHQIAAEAGREFLATSAPPSWGPECVPKGKPGQCSAVSSGRQRRARLHHRGTAGDEPRPRRRRRPC